MEHFSNFSPPAQKLGIQKASAATQSFWRLRVLPIKKGLSAFLHRALLPG
ncbi:hypothetical protein AALG83_04945 [Christensenellaceae bacterium 44-20]